MSLAPRSLALVVCAAAGVAAIVLVPSAAADPDVDTESATAVIEELQEQGYTVEINGVPSGDTSLLTNCTVTEIHNPGNATPDPTSPSPAAPNPPETTTVYVDVACPIQRG